MHDFEGKWQPGKKHTKGKGLSHITIPGLHNPHLLVDVNTT